jgi:hypothetical protein
MWNFWAEEGIGRYNKIDIGIYTIRHIKQIQERTDRKAGKYQTSEHNRKSSQSKTDTKILDESQKERNDMTQAFSFGQANVSDQFMEARSLAGYKIQDTFAAYSKPTLISTAIIAGSGTKSHTRPSTILFSDSKIWSTPFISIL